MTYNYKENFRPVQETNDEKDAKLAYALQMQEVDKLDNSEDSAAEDQPDAAFIDPNIKKSTCKGKDKIEINEYVLHCQDKVIALIEKRNAEKNQKQKTKYNSMINSQLLRLKRRLEQESR